MSLGHSALFKLRRRASENTPSQIRLDHGDLLVMDGLTQLEYEHSTAFELEGPRVNLTFRWISQHIRSCPLAGLICGALPSDAQDLAEPHSRGGGRGNQNDHDLFDGPWLYSVHAFFESMYLMHTRWYVAVITIVWLPFDGEYRDVTI